MGFLTLGGVTITLYDHFFRLLFFNSVYVYVGESSVYVLKSERPSKGNVHFDCEGDQQQQTQHELKVGDESNGFDTKSIDWMDPASWQKIQEQRKIQQKITRNLYENLNMDYLDDDDVWNDLPFYFSVFLNKTLLSYQSTGVPIDGVRFGAICFLYIHKKQISPRKKIQYFKSLKNRTSRRPRFLPSTFNFFFLLECFVMIKYTVSFTWLRKLSVFQGSLEKVHKFIDCWPGLGGPLVDDEEWLEEGEMAGKRQRAAIVCRATWLEHVLFGSSHGNQSNGKVPLCDAAVLVC